MDYQEHSQAHLERLQRDEEAATAWYEIKGCMQATDRYDASLKEVYKDLENLDSKRLENIERALETLRDLITKHAP